MSNNMELPESKKEFETEQEPKRRKVEHNESKPTQVVSPLPDCIYRIIFGFMRQKELGRLFGEAEQNRWKYDEFDRQLVQQKQDRRTFLKTRHPLEKFVGWDKYILVVRESEYILEQVLKESEESERNQSKDGEDQPASGSNRQHPFKKLKLGPGELWSRHRIDKVPFGSRERFEHLCQSLGIDPNLDPMKWSGEYYWISGDQKACLWCYSDPRDSEDYYPRYWEMTGENVRLHTTVDKNSDLFYGWNVGPQVVWRDFREKYY